jgi:glutathione synthase/RimK-type ligase-like ATP-grasp enzyme
VILFITNKEDITTDFVINKLNKRGDEYYRFNTEELNSKVFVNLDFIKDKYQLIDSAKRVVIDLLNVKSVYYRRPKLPSIDEYELSPGEAKFTQSEFYYLLEGIYKILTNKFWISPVYAIREAENKIYQLILAKKIGFEIPQGIITSEEERAKSFIRVCSGCIIKPIKTGFVDDGDNPKIIFTSELTDKDISFLDRIKYCPTYLQKKIDKTCDIRVTVVGERVFAARIESQAFDETKIDWRKGENISVQHKRLDLPQSISDKCIWLTKTLKLQFSAIDLVSDYNGNYYFLEINPNGQWAWIEKRLGYDISGEMINLLERGGHEDTKNS